MGIRKKDWADRFNYKWHSNPSTPDAWVFFNKAIIRPMQEKAWQIIVGDVDGDEAWARQVLKDLGHYKDTQGLTQYNISSIWIRYSIVCVIHNRQPHHVR